MGTVITLDKTVDLEVEFETIRQHYLTDLEELQMKYADKLTEILLAYDSIKSASSY